MRTEEDVLRSLQRYVWQALADDTPLGRDGVPRPWEVRFWGAEGEFEFPFARVASTTAQSSTGPASWQDVSRSYTVHAYPTPQATQEESLIECSRVEELLYVAFNVGFTYRDPLSQPYGIVLAQAPVLGAIRAGTYVYAVTARSADGESVASLPASVTTVGSMSRVFMGWNEVQGASSYGVYVGPDAGHLSLLAVTADAFFVDDGSVAASGSAPPLTGTGTVGVRSAPKRVPLYDYADLPLDGDGSVSFRRSTSDYMIVKSVTIDRLPDPEDDRYWVVIAQPMITWRRVGRVPSGSQIIQDVRLRETV